MYSNWKAQASGCSTSWICMMRERKREDILNPVISGTQALPPSAAQTSFLGGTVNQQEANKDYLEPGIMQSDSGQAQE